MAVITFNKFDLGIDHRKGASVSDANRLVEMKNAHVTTGLATEKRPGLSHVITLTDGTKGLFSANGKLNTFYCSDTTVEDQTVDGVTFKANRLTVSSELADKTLTDVAFVDMFNKFFYVSAVHGDECRHHYLDGSATTEVTAVECPHTKVCMKAKSKIFAVGKDGDTVRYCATGEARDWDTAEDAGFIPTGLNTRGAKEAKALGMYQDKMVVLTRDGAQVWTIDPDPTAMSLDSIVENIGTSFSRSLATVSGDLYFLSDYGFRSITTMQLINQLSDVDIGSPIDDLVRSTLSDRNHKEPITTYFYGNGKYMCAIGNTVYVYTVSRTSKIAAWSRYELPVPVDNWAELEGTLYIRSGNDVYKFIEVYKTTESLPYADDIYNVDTGEWEQKPYETILQIPYMNFKKPGVLKRITGIDVAITGRCFVSVGTDANDETAFTEELEIRGNSYSGGIMPIICVGNEFSFRFRNENGEYFRLDALTVYYKEMGIR